MLDLGRCLCVVVCCAPTLAVAQSFGDLQVVKGMEALGRGDDARALMLLTPVADGPYRGDMRLQARYWAAEASENLGLGEQALVYLKDLDTAMPEVADFIFAQRARALRSLGRWAEARDIWSMLLEEYPSSPLHAEAQYSLADAYYALGDNDRAYAAYDVALRTFGKVDRAPIARYNMARIDEAHRRFSIATGVYRQLALSTSSIMAEPAAARLDALTAGSAAPAATFQQRLQQIDRLLSSRALADAAQAIDALAPSVPSLGSRVALDARRATLAYRKQDFATAIALYNGLIAASAGHTKLEYQRALANVYSASDRFEDAIAIYRNIAEHYRGAREGRDAQYKAAWLAYNGGNYGLGLKLFTEFLQSYPTDRSADEAMWYVAWNAYHLGDLPVASDTLVRLRKTFHRTQLTDRTHYWEGRIMALLGRQTDAIAAYTRAAAHPAGYYGFLATQRLRELRHDTEPHPWDGSTLVASLDAVGVADGLEPERDALPAGGGMRPSRPDAMPWGSAVLDWSNLEGRRALRLMKLGLRREAARIVASLPSLPGFPRAQVDYARARLLYGLGDFAAAYRLVSTSFRSELDSAPSGHARRYFQIAYPDAHSEMVLAAAREFHLSPLLILAIMRQESAFDDQANSWASARGLMQIIPVTGRRIAEVLNLDPYNEGVLREPVVNVRFGTWYLSQLVQKFEGNYILAIGSYNAGPQAMQRWVDARAGCATDEFIEDVPFRETRHYVKSVLANLAVYAQLYGSDIIELPAAIPTSYRDNVNF
jgi:soluble lytic murein transglycosylase